MQAMNRSNPYFMRDQVSHRVSLIMGARNRLTSPASPVWPLVAVITALTVLNVATAIPPL